MSRLFEFPQVFRESRYRRRRVEHDLSSIQPQDSRTFWKMPVVADVHTHTRILGLKYWITKIAGGEVELLPESRMAVRNVMFAVFAEIAAVGIYDGSGVEIHARHVHFVDRYHHHHFVLSRDLPHQLNRGSFRHGFSKFVPTRILLSAKVWSVEKLLQTEDSCLLARCLLDQLQVFIDHGLTDLSKRAISTDRVAGLNQGAADNASHGSSNSTIEEL